MGPSMKPHEINVNRKPYPIISALKREGDVYTMSALRLWLLEYGSEPPNTAANDNDPAVKPIDTETYRYELSAEDLVKAYQEDDVEYSASSHEETRRPQTRKSGNPPPCPTDVDAESEMVRFIDAKRMRLWLGGYAEILDMAIGQFTYQDVGRHIGAVGGVDTLERAGKSEVKSAAKTFYDEAA